MSGIEKEKSLEDKEGGLQNFGADNCNDGMASPRDDKYSGTSEGELGYLVTVLLNGQIPSSPAGLPSPLTPLQATLPMRLFIIYSSESSWSFCPLTPIQVQPWKSWSIVNDYVLRVVSLQTRPTFLSPVTPLPFFF